MKERRLSELNLGKNNGIEDVTRKVGSCVVAAGLVFSSVLSLDLSPVNAFDNSVDLGTSQIVAARSGGRAGGRSSMGARSSPRGGSAYRSAPSAARYYAPARPIVSPVIVSPFGYSPFGYSPFGGLGMGYGLGAMNGIGGELRDQSQDRRLADEQAELAAAKQRAADLEERVKALEKSQLVEPGASATVRQ